MPDLADRPMFGLGEAIEEQRRSPRIGIAVAAVVIAAFVAGIWYVYDRGVRRGDLKALPVITAEGGPVKSSPADAGGLKVPHVDGEMPRAAAGRGSKVEDILPPPERPLAERAPPERKVTEQAAPLEPPRPLASAAPKSEAPKVEAPVAASPPVAAVEVAPRPTPSPPPAAVAKAAPAEPVEKAVPPPAPAQASPAPTSAAPAVSEKAPPSVAAVAPAAGRAGAYRIQLASVGDKKAAEGEWRRLARANGDVLGKLTPSVVTVDLPGKGTFHRLSAGPFADRGAAVEACEALHKRKVGCFVVAP